MKWSILVPLIICGIYCIVVIVIAAVERGESSGGFIHLRGLMTFLATFPASQLFEQFSQFNVFSNVQIAVAMLLNGSLIFAIILSALKLFGVK